MTTTGTQARARMFREAAYNTAPAGDYWKIPFMGLSLGAAQKNVKNPVLGVGSDAQAPFRDVKDATGDLTVPLDARCIGLHLSALFGDPATTDDTGVYTHVFESAAEGQPVSQTIEVSHPGLTAAQYALNTGILYKSMDVSMARSGAATAKFSIVGTDEAWSGASSAGTPADIESATIKYFSHLMGVIKRNNTALGKILTGSFTFDNGLDVAQVLANGGLIGGGVRGQGDLSVNLTARFDDMTLLNDAINGTPVQIDWTLSNSASESIAFTMPKLVFDRPKVEVSGPAGLQVALTGMGYGDSGNKMLTVTLVNDHDGTAYAAA